MSAETAKPDTSLRPPLERVERLTNTLRAEGKERASRQIAKHSSPTAAMLAQLAREQSRAWNR